MNVCATRNGHEEFTAVQPYITMAVNHASTTAVNVCVIPSAAKSSSLRPEKHMTKQLDPCRPGGRLMLPRRCSCTHLRNPKNDCNKNARVLALKQPETQLSFFDPPRSVPDYHAIHVALIQGALCCRGRPLLHNRCQVAVALLT